MSNAVEFSEVTKFFEPDQAALTSVSFQVETGEVLVLLGSSGSGKTTTLKMINRLVEPDSGKVLVEGKDVSDWDPIQLRRRVGYVIQEVGLLPHLTVAKNIELGPRMQGWSEENRRVRSRELLELVGLPPDLFSFKKPSELSGGQRQRVGFARALAADPPLLLMDEPFGALDPITRGRLQEEFLDLEERLHKTVVFVTHDVLEAFRIAHRIGVMDHGKLCQLGTPQAILDCPANDFVRDFVRMESLQTIVERRGNA